MLHKTMNQLLYHADVPSHLKQCFWDKRISEKEFNKEALRGLEHLQGKTSTWATCDYCGRPTQNYIRIGKLVECNFCHK